MRNFGNVSPETITTSDSPAANVNGSASNQTPVTVSRFVGSGNRQPAVTPCSSAPLTNRGAFTVASAKTTSSLRTSPSAHCTLGISMTFDGGHFHSTGPAGGSSITSSRKAVMRPPSGWNVMR